MIFLSSRKALNPGVGLILFFVICALLPGIARTQALASINGTVYDTSGGVVPDATVLLHSKATNLNRTTATNGAGIYVIPDIQPGDYELKVSKEGFKSVLQPNITLVVNQTGTFDITLAAGSITENVTVAAEAVALETSSSELGVAVVKEQVNDLPLNGRNFTQLLNLTPGVSTVNVSQNSTTSGGIWSNPVGTFSYPSINGQTNRSNLYLLDGIYDQGSFGSTYAIAPIVDAIQEFKVQSHNDDTSYGGALGGIINVVTKSGTTQYHATLWEFVRNTNFDARNPFLSKVTPFQQNQFGVAGGGPLSIPWRHSAAPKTFFFAAYEGFRLHTSAANLYSVPTAAELGGDLTTVGGVPFAGQIYNPYSIVPNAASPTHFANSPFLCDAAGNPSPDVNRIQSTGTPCNKIPADMLDQNMIAYAKALFPGPNRTPTGTSAFNAVDTTKSIVRQDEFSARLDHQFTPNDIIFGRWSQFRQPVTGSGGFAGLSHFQISNGYTVGVEYLHTFSSSALLETHFGRVLVDISQGSNFVNPSGATGSSLGFSQNFAGGFIGGIALIPNITINGFIGNIDPSAHGAAHTDRTQGTNIWQVGSNFTKTYGRHTFKIGADFATNNANALYLNAAEVFDSSNTSNAALTGTGGSSLASFLLGDPNSFKRRNVKETEHGGWVDGAYFADSWKITNRLTVSLGVRYDLTLMPIYGSLKDGNGFTGDLNFNNGTYILTNLPPMCAQVNPTPPCIPFGIGPSGLNPQPGQSYLPNNVVVTPHRNGAIFQNDLTDFQPRVGLAYELTRTTVLRGAYGRFYDNWAAVTQSAQNYEGSWPDTGQLGGSLNPLNAPPVVGVAEAPTGTGPAIAGPSPFTGFNWYADPHMQRPYADQFNFGVQHQLGSSTVLTANYVGSRGHRLDIGFSGNTGKIPSAVANYLPTGATTSSPYPYITPADFDTAIGKSSYNALQASLNGRGFHGLTYLISYTWSKTLDLGCTGWYGVEGCSIQNPYTLKNDKGPAGTDVPQILSASWVYQLPFGKGQKYSTDNNAVNYVIGGWTLNGIVSLTSGTPFFVGVSGDIAHIAANTACCALGFGNYERLNFLGGNPYASSKSPSQWLNPAAFAIPAPGTFGNLGRDTLRSDRYKNLDLSLFKQFPITEHKRLEFRFETFNLTNTPVWNIPDVNISDGNKFGTISSTANTARQLQFGLKLYF
jgi:Carboxypeptidase regulatory-like domain/TonB-dependent Receptor Plug Domain/TonB dependent receptor